MAFVKHKQQNIRRTIRTSNKWNVPSNEFVEHLTSNLFAEYFMTEARCDVIAEYCVRRRESSNILVSNACLVKCYIKMYNHKINLKLCFIVF